MGLLAYQCSIAPTLWGCSNSIPLSYICVALTLRNLHQTINISYKRLYKLTI